MSLEILQMSAWSEGDQEEQINDIDKQFEDNFVAADNREFRKLEDSEQYLQNLGLKQLKSHLILIQKFHLAESKLRKIKKDPSVLKQLKEKREECLNNLLNNSLSIRTEEDFELDVSVEPNEIIRHLIPEQAQTVGEIAHLIQHDLLDQQKQEDDDISAPPATN